MGVESIALDTHTYTQKGNTMSNRTLITFHLADEELVTDGFWKTVSFTSHEEMKFVSIAIDDVTIIANTRGIETLREVAAKANEAVTALEAIIEASASGRVS